MLNTAVIVFPGSNCDRDMITTIQQIGGKAPHVIWHADTKLPAHLDLIILPGGFSYGDYLRSGAMAANSPIMNEVIAAAKKGVYILGVCNGFQILTESGLLPGVLLRNKNLHFICRDVHLQVTQRQSKYTSAYKNGQIISIPIAHHDGNYFADEVTIQDMEEHGQIAFRYCDAKGNITDDANPNGSIHNIAGVFDKNKRILGMMPHPERACDARKGRIDGTILFESLLHA